MSFEHPQDQNSEGNNKEILKQNINTLIELFELNDGEGKFSSHQRVADRITAIIQKHTEEAVGGYNRIGDAEKFLQDIRKAKDKMMEEAGDDTDKKMIGDLFNKVDIPDLELGTALTPGDSERSLAGKRVGQPGSSFIETKENKKDNL